MVMVNEDPEPTVEMKDTRIEYTLNELVLLMIPGTQEHAQFHALSFKVIYIKQPTSWFDIQHPV